MDDAKVESQKGPSQEEPWRLRKATFQTPGAKGIKSQGDLSPALGRTPHRNL